MKFYSFSLFLKRDRNQETLEVEVAILKNHVSLFIKRPRP